MPTGNITQGRIISLQRTSNYIQNGKITEYVRNRYRHNMVEWYWWPT